MREHRCYFLKTDSGRFIPSLSNEEQKHDRDINRVILKPVLLLQLALFVFGVLPSAKAQFVQQGPPLVGTGAIGSALQGQSIAVSADGNTAIIGGYADNTDVGAAWVWTRSGGVWTQQGPKLLASDALGTSEQGYSVALSGDGNTALVGGAGDNNGVGAVWVWTRSNGVWTQQGPKLVGSGAVGLALQGQAVALSADGNTALMGGSLDNSASGAVWVWTRSGGVWTQQGPKLVGSGVTGAELQGNAVALSGDGNTALVGGWFDSNQLGAVWVWTRSGGVWTQQGPKLVGTGAAGSAEQGFSVALSADGNTAVVGGYQDATLVGAAWVWTRNAGVWTQQGSKLVGAGATGAALQGYSVAVSGDGNIALVGGPYDNSVGGAVWVWTRTGGVWTQQGTKLAGTGGTAGGSTQGFSVAISADGNTAVEGAPAGSASGAMWVFVSGAVLPSPPSLTSPANVATGVSLNPQLTWSPSSGAASYNVYFGSTSPPAFAANTTATSFSPSTLNPGATYYWRVEAQNGIGVTTSSTWSFTTLAQAGGPCFYSYGPASQNFSSAGGQGSFTISAPAGCAWTIVNDAPFVSALSQVTGTGNGQITYTANPNQSAVQQTGIITITGSGFSATHTVTEAPAAAYACNASTSPSQARAEGVTELVADIVVLCSGGSGGAIVGDLKVTFNANVTSRTIDSSGTSEALLLLNDPAVPVLGVNAFRGRITGANSVLFRSVPLRPSQGTQTMRITNLRVNASQLGSSASLAPVPIVALVQANSAVAVPVSGQQLTVANAQPGVGIRQGNATAGPDATTQTVSLTFTEKFGTAFKPAIAAGQDPSQPGHIYNSESGFVNSAQLGPTGKADTATRLRANIKNIPAGVCVYASVLSSAGTAAHLVAADVNGAAGTFVAGSSIFGGTFQLLTCTLANITATWELTAADPLNLESSSFNLIFQNAGSQISQIQIASSLAPVTQQKFAAADATVPVPRFVDNSVPISVVDLRVSTTFTTQNGGLSLRGGLRPQAIPGGTVGFTEQMLVDSSSAAPNVVTHTILPPALTLAAGACGSPPPGSIWICDPDGHGLTIIHGTVPPHSPITFTFAAKIDPTVLAGTLLQVTTAASSDLPLFDLNNAMSTVTLPVESSGCSPQIPLNAPTQIPATGGSLSFAVASCPPWTAAADQLWLVLTGGSYFTTASANVAVHAAANTGPARSAHLMIADQSVTITQAAGSDVRDFSGTGLSGALLYDPTNGQEYTALSNGTGTYSYVPNLITSAFDILRTGDFNGDGKADLIVYNSHNSLAYIGMGNGDGTFAFQSLFWSPSYDTVETGDINGDGKTDVALYNSATGTLYTGISNGSGGFTYLYHLVTSRFTFVRLADFTGDGKADLFLYNSNNGLAYLGVGDGTGAFTFHPLSMSPGYTLDDIGDLNGDGKADIIVYNPANGNAASGISDGVGGFTFSPLLFSSGFTSVRLADYSGDGHADVTLYNKNIAAAYFGTGNGAGGFTFQSLFWSPAYNVVEPQDVNGDGKMDVILYNSATGTEYTGISNGNGTFSYSYSLWGPGKVLAR